MLLRIMLVVGGADLKNNGKVVQPRSDERLAQFGWRGNGTVV